MQAAYNELGLTEARLLQSTLPPSPTLAWTGLAATGALEIERQAVVSVLAILTLPRRQDIAEVRFRAAQLKAAEETLRVAAEARRAYYRAVAANRAVSFLEEARVSAEAVSELAKKLGETGALSRLDQAREHAFHAELSAQLGSARLRAAQEREKLIRALGLWGSGIDFKLPKHRRSLPPRPKNAESIEREAIACRVDLQIARLELEALAKSLGLTQATRFVNLLQVDVLDKHEKSSVIENGTRISENFAKHGESLEFQIPIFDFNETRIREGEQSYMRAANLILQKAVNIRSEARLTYMAYRGTYDIARHYETSVLPLRKLISEEMLLRYNGMIADPFQLLADARERITANIAAIDALRDFWLSTVDMQTAVYGGGGDVNASLAGALIRASAASME